MAGFAFRKNTIFNWNGGRFRVCEIPPNADMLVQACDTGEMKLVPLSMLLGEYTQGRLSACVDEQELRVAKATYSRPLDDLAKPLRDEAKRRLHYVNAVAANGYPTFTEEYLNPLLRLAAEEIQDNCVPSVSSVFRWFKKYMQARKDARALIPRFDLRGSPSARCSRIGRPTYWPKRSFRSTRWIACVRAPSRCCVAASYRPNSSGTRGWFAGLAWRNQGMNWSALSPQGPG